MSKTAREVIMNCLSDVEGQIGLTHYIMDELDDAGLVTLQQEEVSAQQEEVRALRAALHDEWVSNHDEHCDNKHGCESFGGETECHWPRPKALIDE